MTASHLDFSIKRILMNETTEALTEGLLGDFLDESSELMRRLNEGLFQLDRAVKAETGPVETDQELLNDIFRRPVTAVTTTHRSV